METDNRLIAEFMKYVKVSNEVYPLIYLIHEDWFATDELKFHKDWNWLMEVVEKVLTVGNDTDQWDNVLNELQTVNISNVYNACVEFINWYNEQKL